MKLANYGVKPEASMYFTKLNDQPMRHVYCPFCGKHILMINYTLIEFTNTSGATLKQAQKEVAAVMSWECRGCHTIINCYLR